MTEAERLKEQIMRRYGFGAPEWADLVSYDTAYVPAPFRLEKAHPNRHLSRKAAKLARSQNVPG